MVGTADKRVQRCSALAPGGASEGALRSRALGARITQLADFDNLSIDLLCSHLKADSIDGELDHYALYTLCLCSFFQYVHSSWGCRHQFITAVCI